MITLYGIKNCDTCRKARKWLDGAGIEHRYHDFRVDGLEPETVAGWIAELGGDVLINRRGTTWRNLPETERERATGDGAAVLIAANPTLIKRPVFDLGDRRMVGFTDDTQAAVAKAG
jgi:arsenate reductase